MPKSRPTGITVDRTRKVLAIPWDDGHRSEYPLSLLREACPCAECRGGHANMGPPPDPLSVVIPLAPSKSYAVRDLKLVGNYAMQIEWGDGHMFGIYTWDYLRGLCPCDECAADRAGERELEG
jgi:DUF971 family protein